jgi:hypothetical protein
MRPLLLVLACVGCASLYHPGTRLGAARDPACAALDAAHTAWSGVAAGAAYATGATGLGSLALTDPDARVALGITTLVAGVVGAVATHVTVDYARRLHADPACADAP